MTFAEQLPGMALALHFGVGLFSIIAIGILAYLIKTTPRN